MPVLRDFLRVYGVKILRNVTYQTEVKTSLCTFSESYSHSKNIRRESVRKRGGERVKNGAKKGTENGSEKGMETGRETGLQDGRKRDKKGNGNGARKRTGNGSENRRGTEAKRSKKRARQNGGAFRKMLCGEMLSGVFGRGSGYFRQTESGNECGSRRNRAEMHDRNIRCAATV